MSASPRRTPDPSTALTAATQVMYEVFRDGTSTQRRFTSKPAASRYATAVKGEVRAVG